MAHVINARDNKYSHYCDQCHTFACVVEPGAIMAELCMKYTGACKGTGGSMHIFGKDDFLKDGWELFSENMPYLSGEATSILIDWCLGISDNENIEKQNVPQPKDDDQTSVVIVDEDISIEGFLRY